jgi:outer membrane protein assembly factor BamB
MNRLPFLGALLCLSAIGGPLHADDWPTLGRDKTRNPVSAEKNPPLWWQVAPSDGSEPGSNKNVKWHAPLGRKSLSDPVIANGLVWAGAREGNLSTGSAVLSCFREKDGKLLYEYRYKDPPGSKYTYCRDGHSSSPLIERERAWFVTARGETVCLDIGPLMRGVGQPRELWKVDMVKDLGVFTSVCWCPEVYVKSCSIPPSYKGRIFVSTANGLDDDDTVPSPFAPNLVCLDKDTGHVLWRDNSAGKNIQDGHWASPLVIEINGRGQVIAPQGDGWLRSFDAMTGQLIWKFNANASGAANGKAPTPLYATPVYHAGRVYFGNDVKPQSGRATCHFYCIDPTREGDISPEIDDGPGLRIRNPNSGLVWKHGGMRGDRRVFDGTTASAAIANGLVIVAETNGYLDCLDAKSGKPYWRYDVREGIKAAPLIVGGKIYLGTLDGAIHIVELGKDFIVERIIDLDASMHAAPVFANGVLYVATDKLYAIAGKEQPPNNVQPSKGHRQPDCIFVPTPHDIVEKMLTLAKVKKSDVVYDLGCGDGRIVVTAAKQFGCRALGVDLDPHCIANARERVKKAEVGDLVSIEQRDLFTVDLSKADVVALYLLPKLNVKLLPQLAKLKPGARVVSHTFGIEGHEPDETVRIVSAEDGVEHTLYLWTMPFKKAK